MPGDTKWCNKCKKMLPVGEFYQSRVALDGLSTYCAFHTREHTKKYTRKWRTETIEAMGGKCVRCGFSDHRALQFDHIHGDGHMERKAQKGWRDTKASYQRILANPDKYQLLCANCNVIKRLENGEATGPRKQREKPILRLVPARNMSKFDNWKCPNGHETNEANTYVSPRGQKKCRVCRRKGEKVA